VTDPVWRQGTKMLSYGDFVAGTGFLEQAVSDGNFVSAVNVGPTATRVRLCNGAVRIQDGGWHFSYTGGYEAIAKKIRSFSHQEFNEAAYTSADHIKRCIARGDDLFGRPYRFAVLDPTASLPVYVSENQEKYTHLINRNRPMNDLQLVCYRQYCLLRKRMQKWFRKRNPVNGRCK